MGLTSFQNADGTFKKGTHWRPHADFRDRQYLLDNYVVGGRSTGDIAKDFGVTDAAILHWLRRHRIPRRTVSAARKLKHWGCAGPANPMYGRKGAANHNYVDGSSPERQRTYSQFEWKQLLLVIYRRDEFKCQRCKIGNVKGHKLIAHHIKPWAGFPAFRRDPDNLVTLCTPCHRWVHSKNNILKEWLYDLRSEGDSTGSSTVL